MGFCVALFAFHLFIVYCLVERVVREENRVWADGWDEYLRWAMMYAVR